MVLTDDYYKELVIAHDKHIDTLAGSIETLAKSVASTNNKLDDMIDVMSKQNVLFEKFNNLEENLKESFSMVHKRIETVEKVQGSKDGCQAVSLLKKDVDALIKIRNVLFTLVGSTIVLAILGTVIIK